MTKKSADEAQPTVRKHPDRLRESAPKVGINESGESFDPTLKKVASKAETRRDMAEASTKAARTDTDSKLQSARTKTAGLKAQRLARSESEPEKPAVQPPRSPKSEG